MKYSKLGKSSLQVSGVSFGCMSLSGSEDENIKLLHRAFDKGINFYDTADLYGAGANEATVGKAFKNLRNKVLLATKAGNQLRADGSGWDWNPSKSYILEAVEKSLKRLQTDYIDLYQLHGGTIEDPIDETIEAFELLKQQGKIRYYGISSIRPNVIREYVKRSGIVSVMMQYSLLDRRPEETALELLQENQVGVLARGSFAQGLLLGKEPKSYLSYSSVEVSKAAEAITSVAATTRDAATVAGRFVLQNGAVTSVVAGIRTEEQLEQALLIADAPALSEEEMAYLKQAIAVNQYEQHR
ncbi:aldo/keto reductase [Pontibacter sp. SGAir0037]|uniref:aldo/keto reductase n=1 Tax=Pontibacter sp. SGAir0037 TaxID=2571030 RepID=UPI0010CCCE18|nr:aldo/keto reductase [Pontibacter sp. SGAir0037]QCR22225.1 oxidoreductase [Pontibacter sp. SGAir0037]